MWGKPANTNVDAEEQNSKSSVQMSCFQFLTESAERGRDLQSLCLRENGWG